MAQQNYPPGQPGRGGRGGGGRGGQPHPQSYNYAARGGGNGMGAWQPTQPATAGSPYPPQQQQQQQQQLAQQAQQQAQQAQQQHVQQHQRVPQQQQPPQAYPPQYAYNPYATQQAAQYNPRQWQQQQAYPNMQGGVFYPGQMQQQQQQQQAAVTAQPAVLPPARKKKPLQITDKDGNVIDFSAPKKSDAAPKAAAVVTPTEKKSAEDAGAKLRQAALEALGGEKKPATTEPATIEPSQAEKAKLDAEAEAKQANDDKAKKEADEKAKEKKEVEEKAAAAETKTVEAPVIVEKKSSLAELAAKEKEVPAAKAPASASTETLAADTSSGRLVYTKEKLLSLKDLPVCMERPADLPELVITKSEVTNKGRGGPGGGGGGSGRRNSQRDQGGGGGGDAWARGSAPPRRQSSQNDGKQQQQGGGDWSRGHAPPKQQPNQQQGQGGRPGQGHGGRGRHNQVPLYDGPIEPLVKSENHWRPTKNSSALIIAEKKVKGILNKMTKEKFERLSTQMLEIPIVSYETLTLMIDNVYDKAIDEPAFGDMYADLCIRLSETVKGTQFVHIIESDEEPPTDDGEAAPVAADESTSHTVYRWSNDISTADEQIVGPLSSAEECMTAAFDEAERTPTERGDMELELVSVTIKRSIFIKIMKKKMVEEGEADVFYAVYFPASEAKELGQQLSDIFLSQFECQSDANKKNTFKRSLLNKCEEEFNKQDIYADWKKEKKEYEETKHTLTPRDSKDKADDLNFRRIKIKKQMLGNVKFIGQLYKKNLLKEKIMRYCIGSLLKLDERKDIKGKNPEYTDSGETDMDEEDHEAICSMFSTIGATIDKLHATDFMNVCFSKIEYLSQSDDLPSRSKFMYKDMLDLRSNGWVPRRKEEKAKTIAEIRKDVEREERRQAQQSAQNNRGGRGGGGYNDRGGDYRSQRPMGGSRSHRAPKAVVHTDDDGFTTVSTGKVPPPKSPQKPRESAKLPATGKPKPAVTAAATASLSTEQLERKVKSMRSDFMSDGGDVKELLMTWDEIALTPEAGKVLVANNCDRMMDCKENERLAIVRILNLLCEKGKLTKNDIQGGLVDSIEFIDSLVVDSPRAYEYLGEILADMLRIKMFDMAWLCDKCELTKVEPGTKAPEKLIRFTLLALKKTDGADAAKSHLSEKKLTALLGADTLQAITDEF